MAEPDVPVSFMQRIVGLMSQALRTRAKAIGQGAVWPLNVAEWRGALFRSEATEPWWYVSIRVFFPRVYLNSASSHSSVLMIAKSRSVKMSLEQTGETVLLCTAGLAREERLIKTTHVEPVGG
jgi:hypothetical protein